MHRFASADRFLGRLGRASIVGWSLVGVLLVGAADYFTGAEVSALGALLDYLELAQAGSPARLAPPKRQAAQSVMAIDPATRASLEIERTLQGHRKGSLLDAVDRTVTAPGARLLASRIGRPSTDRAEIEARLSGTDRVLAAVSAGLTTEGADPSPDRRP